MATSIDNFFEALHRDVSASVNNRLVAEGIELNWLDAATPAWLVENTDKIITAFASKMAIRYACLEEMYFVNNGYSGNDPIARFPNKNISEESARHTKFYLKTRARIEKLARLDSINRRSQLAVIKFPANKPATQPIAETTSDQDSGYSLGNSSITQSSSLQSDFEKPPKDLVQLFDQLRRKNIAVGDRVVFDRGEGTSDWLDDARFSELEEAADTILTCTAARKAIRSSIRLEKVWKQNPSFNNAWPDIDLLEDVIQERDRNVNSYLKLRETVAKIEHNRGIISRSENDATMSKPRRPHARRKSSKTA